MASLYNSSTGVLKVNNLEASGNITAAGYGEFGNAYIGPLVTTNSNWAAFSHKDNKTSGTDYALMQKNDGTLNINSKDDKGVNIYTNSDVGKAVTIKNGNITATGYGEFGNAYIGKWKTDDSKWAAFSHKDNSKDRGDYALVQNNAGRTVINSSEGQVVQVSNNDTGPGNIHTNTLTAWGNINTNNLTATNVTVTGTCGRGNHKDKNTDVNHPAPIKLTNGTCHFGNNPDNLAIGGKAFVQAYVY